MNEFEGENDTGGDSGDGFFGLTNGLYHPRFGSINFSHGPFDGSQGSGTGKIRRQPESRGSRRRRGGSHSDVLDTYYY